MGEDWDPMRVDYALKQHEQWYLGDGMYSDGPEISLNHSFASSILPSIKASIIFFWVSIGK